MENEEVGSTVICDICKSDCEAQDVVEFNGKRYCEVCAKDDLVICDKCFKYEYRDESECVGGKYYCDGCNDEYLYKCDYCSEHFLQSDATWIGDFVYCDRCRRRHISYCSRCENNYWDGEECECGGYTNSGLIKERHSHKDEFQFIGKSNTLTPYMGFELEVEYKGQDRMMDYVGKPILLDNFLLEEDGSLNNGFEIISHALTYKKHRARKELYCKTFQYLSDSGFRSHNTTTCGLHVHVSRKGMRNTPSERFLVNFVYANRDKFIVFSRRESKAQARYTAYYKGYPNDTRYVAVNLCNRNTIEFRMFRGTLKYNTFMATMQMCRCLYLWAKEHKQESTNYSWKQFIEFIKHKHSGMGELLSYLKAKQILS